MDIALKFENFLNNLQQEICKKFETIDQKEKFTKDIWERAEGGGGVTCTIKNGNVFEKGGVAISKVFGKLPESLKINLNTKGENFYANGISLIMHPNNPFIPTVHANFRYFEMYDKNSIKIDSWFGGGTDLTPYYFFEEDAIHFHKTLKETCDKFSLNIYPQFKKNCDEYFYLPHRKEHRGIGGIFFDYLKPTTEYSEDQNFELTTSLAETFLKCYCPIVEKRKDIKFSDKEKDWQSVRRGRYVEFNLLYDRGTLFGLKSNGRIESIFMSLPPNVKWEYDFNVKLNSPEAFLLENIKPKNWC